MREYEAGLPDTVFRDNNLVSELHARFLDISMLRETMLNDNAGERRDADSGAHVTRHLEIDGAYF